MNQFVRRQKDAVMYFVAIFLSLQAVRRIQQRSVSVLLPGSHIKALGCLLTFDLQHVCVAYWKQLWQENDQDQDFLI